MPEDPGIHNAVRKVIMNKLKIPGDLFRLVLEAMTDEDSAGLARQALVLGSLKRSFAPKPSDHSICPKAHVTQF